MAITGFEAPKLGLQPTEEGVQAFAGAGRRVGAFYNQAAQATERTGEFAGRAIGGAIKAVGDEAVKYVDHQQISAGAAKGTEMLSNLTEEKNKVVSGIDPNDPLFGQKVEVALKQWREERLTPALDQFTGGFSTEKSQEWAQHFVAATRQHMFTSTNADITTAAKIGINNSITTLRNTASNTALNDPSSLPMLLDQGRHSIAGMVGSSNLKGADAAKVNSETLEKFNESVVKSAAIGEIMKTGQVPSWVNDPKYSKYVSGAELKQLAQTANYYKHINAGEERSARVEEERQQKNDLNGKLNDIEREMLPQKPGDEPKVPSDVYDRLRQAYIHPGAKYDRSAIEATVRKTEAVDKAANKPEPLTRVSHETSMDLLKRIRATDNSRLTDNSEIYDAYGRGDLNRADFGFLVNEFNNLRTPDGAALDKDRTTFTKSYARLIDGMMNERGDHSLLGTQKMYAFEMDARRQEAELRKEGKDPHLVYDPRPGNPYFWGSPENIARYRVSMKDAQDYEKDIKKEDEVRKKAAAQKPTTNLTGPNTETLPRVRNQADYEKLEPGTRFTDDHGNPFTKPGKK